MNLSTTARVSDMLKLYLTLHRVPLMSLIFFGAGSVGLFLALSLFTYILFGLKPAIANCIVLMSGSIVFFYINNSWILKVSHVVYYWMDSHPEDYKQKILTKIDEFEQQIIDEEKGKKIKKEEVSDQFEVYYAVE